MERNRGRGGKQSCRGDVNCRAHPSRAEAVHIQIKSRGSAHPRGVKLEGEEEMLTRTCRPVPRAAGGWNWRSSARSHESKAQISGEEGGRLESK